MNCGLGAPARVTRTSAIGEASKAGALPRTASKAEPLNSVY
jgi:hypothetical protein